MENNSNNNDFENKYRGSKNKGFSGFIFGMIFTLFFLVALILIDKSGVINVPYIGTTASSVENVDISEEEMDYLEKVIEYKKLLEKTWYQEIDEKVLYDGMIKGMYESTGDKYTTYFTDEEWSNFYDSVSGSYVGIGVYIEYVDLGIKITRVMQGSPALEAGMQANDIITDIDDQAVLTLGYDKAINIIKGEPNTIVHLNILRETNGVNDSISLDVERRQISVPAVSSTMIQDTGLIQISEFDSDVYQEFITHYDRLVEQGMQDLIIDLRNNPGGDLYQCVQLTGILVDEDLILYEVDRAGNRKDEKSKNKMIDIPFVILVNENSASASEVLTGAVKDYATSTIIGDTTFGKGVVQQLYPSATGDGAKITISEYFSPLGNKIHEIGIEPDIKVEMDVRDMFYIDESKENQNSEALNNDIQIQKALEILN